MAPHSSTLAWKIPWTEEPGGLQSMGSLRVGYDWATSLSLFTFTFHFHALEKEMATHSSVLAWRIPGTGEPGGLPSLGSHRVGHDWSDLAAAAAKWFLVGLPAQMFHPGLQTFLQVTNFPHNLALFYILSAAYNSSLSFRLLQEGPYLKEVFVETPSRASPWNDEPPQLRLSACCACYFFVFIADCYHVFISVITSLIFLGSPKNRGLPRWLGGKNPLANSGDEGSIPGSGRSPREGNVTHSSILAWEIPWQRILAGYSPWGHKESHTT